MSKIAVVAIGGNALIKDESKKSFEDQYEVICETAKYIVDMIEEGINVVVTHGNGPQVGYQLRRSELAYEAEKVDLAPLVNCVCDTQGSIGYQIQQAIGNEFKKRNMPNKSVTVVTQVIVDKDDQAFKNPTKPIGSFYSEEAYKKLTFENPTWTMISDSGRGYRRVVASPKPIDIVEKEAILDLANQGYCVIATGGGGIPVIRESDGTLTGVDAVIDKDFASSLLAAELNADLFVVSTGVEKVYINFNKPNQKALDQINIEETEKLIEEGHFAPGSMLPKIEAALQFIKSGGKKALITDPSSLKRAIKGETGTVVTQ